MPITLNGSTGIDNSTGGYTGDGILFADGTPANTLVTTTGGVVGIGTNAPSSLVKLDVNGSVATLGDVVIRSAYSLRLVESTNNNTWFLTNISNNLVFSYNGTGRFTFESGGTLQTAFIGNGTGTAVVIDANGRLRASTSSRRYKENILPIDVGLDMVMQMQPVKYNLKDSGDEQVGFIAEDFPESRLVNYALIDPNDPEKGEQIESVNYNNLAAILTKAIQELKAELDSVKAELATLKSA